MQIIEEVIHEEEEESVYSRKTLEVEPVQVEDPQFLLPQQTYHHMIGRSFGVAFNDRSFIKPDNVTSGSDRYYYGGLGKFCQPRFDDMPTPN